MQWEISPHAFSKLFESLWGNYSKFVMTKGQKFEPYIRHQNQCRRMQFHVVLHLAI